MTKQAKSITAGNDLIPHPIADAVPGEMDADEMNALISDLTKNGQQHPITLYEGKILDGRNRYKALQKLGKQPRVEAFKGTDLEARRFVISTNLQRRTLTGMQKALVAARECKAEGSTLTQQEGAAMVGCSVQSVNLCIKAIVKGNAPLLKRLERGDVTRGELEELLYESIQRGANARVPAAEVQGDANEEELDELVGDVEGHESKKGKAGNVVKLDDHRPMNKVGKKPSRAGKIAVETPASRCAQTFKGLTEAERKSFVELTWQWLEPALKAAGKLKLPITREEVEAQEHYKASTATPTKATKRKRKAA